MDSDFCCLYSSIASQALFTYTSSSCIFHQKLSPNTCLKACFSGFAASYLNPNLVRIARVEDQNLNGLHGETDK